MKELDICEYLSVRKSDDLLIDVRSAALFKLGTIEDAINIPLEEIGKIYDLPSDKNIYVFCEYGDYSGEVAELLADAGYNAVNLKGGYLRYIREMMKGDQTDGKR